MNTAALLVALLLLVNESALAWMTMKTSSTPKVLGICGGIGSGKSSACKLLVEQLTCWQHLEADRMAHSVYAMGSPAIDEIVSAFGPSVLLENGEMDRAALGRIVFSDPVKMTALEHIVWPYVKQEISDAISTKKNEHLPQGTLPIIVLEAAVLIDAGWEDLLDGLWVIKVKPETAIKRLIEQRGLTKDDAEIRIQAQKSRRGIGNLEEEMEKGIVTKVIDNDDDLDALATKLKEALNDALAWRS